MRFFSRQNKNAMQQDKSLEPGISSRGPDALPDHVLTRMKKMLLESMGKLPAPLVIILLSALLLSVLAGLALKFSARDREISLLPLRVSVDQAAPVVSLEAVEGMWAFTPVDGKGPGMVLRLEKGVFEWVVKPIGQKYERVFARGNYRIDGNIMIFGQRGDMGKPATSVELGLVFFPMNLQSLNVKVEQKGQIMAWIIPASELRRMDDDMRHMFAPASNNRPMAWVRMTPQ